LAEPALTNPINGIAACRATANGDPANEAAAPLSSVAKNFRRPM
jgi:hypothetical protein